MELLKHTEPMVKEAKATNNEEILKISELGKVCLTKEESTEDVLFPIQECFDPKSPTDKKVCVITSMAILPDGKRVLSDVENKALKLFNNEYEFVCELCLDSPTTSVIAISDQEVVVCCPVNVLRIKISNNKMYIGTPLKTKLMVLFVARYSADVLSVLSFDDEKNVFWQIVNLDGDIQKNIKLDELELKRPVAFSSVNGQLYFLDSNNGLAVFNENGECTNKYKQDNAEYMGLAIDDRGHVFSAVEEKDMCVNIAKLSPDGHFIKMLFPESRKYLVLPLTCHENKLYVYIRKENEEETASGNATNDGTKEE